MVKAKRQTAFAVCLPVIPLRQLFLYNAISC